MNGWIRSKDLDKQLTLEASYFLGISDSALQEPSGIFNRAITCPKVAFDSSSLFSGSFTLFSHIKPTTRCLTSSSRYIKAEY